jgi:hypothetical protein
LPVKLRFRLRKVLWAIALIGVALAVARYPYFALQSNARFHARSQEAVALIASYDSFKPPEIAAQDWQAAVHHVKVVWDENLPRPEYISDAEPEEILDRMHKLHDRTNSFRSKGDLYSILDLLGHFNSKVPATNALYTAATLLGKLGPAAKAAIPALEAAVEDRSFAAPLEAARALQMIHGE